MPDAVPQASIVDESLAPLLDPLGHALRDRRMVVLHTLWQRIPHIALLPFHLHLRWPSRLADLPLSTGFVVLPFLGRDARLTHLPLYTPGCANMARRKARHDRWEAGTALDGDFVHPDWEEGFSRHEADLFERLLPGRSFLAVDTIGRTGTISRGSRSGLGAVASRTAPRPHILVPGQWATSAEAYVRLADEDIVLVDLQSLRGTRQLHHIREVLRRRGDGRPTLVVTSSPSDLVHLGWDELRLAPLDCVMSVAPQLRDIRVTIVGKDRPQAERQFEFAIGELAGYSDVIDHLIGLAKSAWWASRQRVAAAADVEPAWRRFQVALDRARTSTPVEAQLLTAAERLIASTYSAASLAAERALAIADAVFATRASSAIWVLARNVQSARQVELALSERVQATLAELVRAGIDVGALHRPSTAVRPDHVVVCGYFGLVTLDAVLASGASSAHLIMDPIEARAAWYGARDLAVRIARAGSPEAERILRCFCSALEPHLLPFTDLLLLRLDDACFPPALPNDLAAAPASRDVPDTGMARIIFVDGTSLEVPLGSRLEVVGRQGTARLQTKTPADLQPGDELVLVDAEARILFSERLMTALDAGPLQPLAEQRETWFAIVNSVVQSSHPNIRALHRRLLDRGIRLNYGTVLSWACAGGDQSTPARWPHFRAFAAELGIQLPDDYLAELYRAVRLWRIRHRLAGRKLVRAMRGAYLGRLDATTLARVEREWGLDARALVQSTQLAEVDSVLLPEGEHVATH